MQEKKQIIKTIIEGHELYHSNAYLAYLEISDPLYNPLVATFLDKLSGKNTGFTEVENDEIVRLKSQIADIEAKQKKQRINPAAD